MQNDGKRLFIVDHKGTTISISSFEQTQSNPHMKHVSTHSELQLNELSDWRSGSMFEIILSAGHLRGRGFDSRSNAFLM
jgi:hypothetical protein